MKTILKWSVFLAAFGVGAAAVWLSSSVALQPLSEPNQIQVDIDADPSDPAPKPSGIHVAFAGWDAGDKINPVPTLKFLIHNGTLAPILYYAHSPESPFPTLTVDGGEPIPILGCGTGIKTYFILPGTSALVRVTKHRFRGHVKTGTKFTVGFYLETLTGTSKVHSSPAFELPKRFLHAISQ
jgi:hypothetical protein